MADERIHQWTDDPAPADDVRIAIDRADFTEGRSCTKSAFFADEVAARTAADNAIIDGAGLNADGSMSPDPASAYLKAADFAAAGYDVNLRNGLRLLDDAIADIAANNEQSWQIDISSAEILALNSTPVTKLSAPGAGLHFHIYECDAFLDYGTSDYVSAGANGIDVIFTGAADQIVRLPIAFLQASADTRYKFLVASHELMVNTGIDVYAPDGDPINGDSTISIRLRGQIQTALAYGGAVGTSNCCVQPLWDTFDNGDLTVGGNLEVYHGFNSLNVMGIIFDNTNLQVACLPANGDESGADTYNYLTFPIGGPIAGTWRYILFVV